MEGLGEIKALLGRIYGESAKEAAFQRIAPLLSPKGGRRTPVADGSRFSEKEIVLITYGDSLRSREAAPLQDLKRFADRFLLDVASIVHVLPFFPYSSDDGFAVKDFFRVDPQLGTWEDIASLGEHFRLMFDMVLNHVSAQSDWFARYLDDEPGYQDLAVEADPSADFSRVVRPRPFPLLTPFQKRSGRTVHVWTTFGPDQVDLNYRSLDVLSRMVEVLLWYTGKGAAILRLDAVAYLWKEIGTACIHLSRTHDMVKLFRRILDLSSPGVLLLTETNVPHPENISYFGHGGDEAQLVYNFTLPPLLLHTFLEEDAAALSAWARGLDAPAGATSFLNFTASHDGIGVRPLEGILPPRAIRRLCDMVAANGGRISYKTNPDGTQSPYELNITYIDALARLGDSEEELAERFLASQGIQLILPGIPAIYLNAMLGSRNWEAGVRRTGQARTINREKFDRRDLEAELKADTLRSRIFFRYRRMVRIRKMQPAFHPHAAGEVMEIHPSVFGLERFAKEQRLMTLTNISSRPRSVELGRHRTAPMKDLVSGAVYTGGRVRLNPYQFVWLMD